MMYPPKTSHWAHFRQVVDLCSLLLVFSMLYRAYVTHRGSYEEEADSLPVLPMVAASFLLAALLHADMNSHLAKRGDVPDVLDVSRSTPVCCLATAV